MIAYVHQICQMFLIWDLPRQVSAGTIADAEGKACVLALRNDSLTEG